MDDYTTESRDYWFRRCNELEKKIQNLQIEIGALEGERDGLKMVVERLKEENQTLEKLNEEYRKQIDKLRTDNVYEEGLYD